MQQGNFMIERKIFRFSGSQFTWCFVRRIIFVDKGENELISLNKNDFDFLCNMFPLSPENKNQPPMKLSLCTNEFQGADALTRR